MMYAGFGFPVTKVASFPSSKAFGAYPYGKGFYPYGKGMYPYGKGFYPYGKGMYPYGKGYGFPYTKGYASSFVIPNTTVATTPFVW